MEIDSGIDGEDEELLDLADDPSQVPGKLDVSM